MKLLGIHHLNLIVGHPQQAIDFYHGVLNLDVLKQSVDDAIGQIEVYFGYQDTQTLILKTIAYFNKEQGILGDGFIGNMILGIQKGSLDHWKARLSQFEIEHVMIERAGHVYLSFKDPFGSRIEMIESHSSLHELVILGVLMYTKSPEDTYLFIKNELALQESSSSSYYNQFLLDEVILQFNKVPTIPGALGIGMYQNLSLLVNEDDYSLWKEKLSKDRLVIDESTPYYQAFTFFESGGLSFQIATPSDFTKDLDDVPQGMHLVVHQPKSPENEYIPLFIRPVERMRRYAYETKSAYLKAVELEELLPKINAFAKLAKTRDLTEEETAERQKLRKRYIELVTGGLRNMVDNVYIVEKDGTKNALEKKKDIES